MTRFSTCRTIIAAAAVIACTGQLTARQAEQQPAASNGTFESLPYVALLDEQLQVELGRLHAIDNARIVIEQDGGEPRVEDMASIIAVYPAHPRAHADAGVGAVPPSQGQIAPPAARIARRLNPPAPPQAAGPQGLLALVDGQMYPGQFGESAPEGAVPWRHPRFGQIVFPLERIAFLSQPGGPPHGQLQNIWSSADSDVLLLSNGDRLHGFLSSLGPPVTFDGDSGLFQLEREVIAAATLANLPAAAQGPMLWLDDGTVCIIDSLAFEEFAGAVVLPAGQRGNYAGVRWLTAFIPQRERLLGLANIPPTSQSVLGERRYVQLMKIVPHPLDLGLASGAAMDCPSIQLPGPMEVTWQLPTGATRFAATASLDHADGPWADCELVVLAGGQELQRHHLHPGNPLAPINVPTTAGELTLRLEPAAFGPLQDQITLHRPIVLLAE